MTTTVNTEYLSAADTAKLVRRALKSNFPGVKFSVRSHTYAGGASIDVNWTDGPVSGDVESVVRVYEGSKFDGSIDLKYSRSHWLRPDGSVLVEYDPGTVGSMGREAGEDNRDLAPVIPADARRVTFLADFVMCHRSISDLDARVDDATRWLYENETIDGRTGNPNVDQVGSYPVTLQAGYMVRSQRDGEDWGELLDRLLG